jgi:hypothetical protein
LSSSGARHAGFVTNTFRREIGQEGGNQASDPGYCGGSFMAAKLCALGAARQRLAGSPQGRARPKAEAAGLGGKMFRDYLSFGINALRFPGIDYNLWKVLPRFFS